MFNFINNIGPTELILIIIILIVLFGAKVVTGLGKSSGETVREIKKIKKEFIRSIEDDEPDKN